MSTMTQINLPTTLVERLQEKARAMGLDLSSYVAFLEQLGRLDPKAQDAARFMFAKHEQSLRKLAE